MKKIGIAFCTPQSIFGWMVVLRTQEHYSHAVVIDGDNCYSAELTNIRKKPFDAKIYEEVYWLDLTDDEYNRVIDWLESRIGKHYDYMAVLAFLFGIKELEDKKHFYCFELCREALVRTGKLEKTDDLIYATRLIHEIKLLASQ